MKPSILKITTVLIFIFVSVSSCKKSSTSGKTKTQLLTQSNWVFSNAIVNGLDISGFLQSCQTDNILTFSANGSGVLDEGATKCNSNDPQTRSFTWSFMSNETTLHISDTLFAGGNNDFHIVALSETQLGVSQNITVSGSSQNAIVTFIH